jgi:TRAP-type C4-dicarboxylate transport system permease small subunit
MTQVGNHAEGTALAAPSGRARALKAADGLDRLITVFCRFVVLVTGIALTAILTGNVVARYVFASGGIDAAQELPERLFPWFIIAGIALAAQAGGHMSVDWLLDKLRTPGRRKLLLVGNAIVVMSYGVLCQQALALAEIAKLERSPVLDLPNSHGYWAMALGCILVAVVIIAQSVRIAVSGPETRFSLAYREI